jgi:murein DD-endopeptidase MepM/ murein hydrolase activator NlpD
MNLATIQGGPYGYGETAYITSLFGPRDPVLLPDGSWLYGDHTGLDSTRWPVASGVYQLYAIFGGTVIVRDGVNDANGYSVGILSDDGNWYAEYLHLSDQPVVAMGQRVPAGKLLGWLGTTGYSTGPHLHLGIMYQWTYVDPLTFLLLADDEGVMIPGSNYFDVDGAYHDELGHWA